jgi:hypothetical protein
MVVTYLTFKVEGLPLGNLDAFHLPLEYHVYHSANNCTTRTTGNSLLTVW